MALGTHTGPVEQAKQIHAEPLHGLEPDHHSAPAEAPAADLESDEPDNFAAAFKETPLGSGRLKGRIVTGRVVGVGENDVTVDVALKTDGIIPMSEFGIGDNRETVAVGDQLDVFVLRMEDRNGLVELSRERARREAAWKDLEERLNTGQITQGIIHQRVKGGYKVDLDGASAFLPGSQVDIRPMRDASVLFGTRRDFKILKMDRARGNIVVSRRTLMEEERTEKRQKVMANLAEGDEVDGIVKNITDYGAFIDLGGVDGLLHLTDIAWERVAHPSERLTIGETIRVKIIRFNPTAMRISLGLKQLEHDPWSNVAEQFPEGGVVRGTVTSIADYGVFVELKRGVKGLVHVSEMSWLKRSVHPEKLVSVGDEIDVKVLEVSPIRRRVSLGMRQCQPNPWEELKRNHPENSILTGTIRNVTEFGLFVGLPGGIDGMVRLGELDWFENGKEALKKYKSGDEIEVKIIRISPEEERVHLSVKALHREQGQEIFGDFQRGAVVTGVVSAVQDRGVELKLSEHLHGFIRRSDLSIEASEQRVHRFAEGEKVDAKIISVDRKTRKVLLSIKAMEQEENQRAITNYGSSDAGASLGEILGSRMRQKLGQSASSAPLASSGGRSSAESSGSSRHAQSEKAGPVGASSSSPSSSSGSGGEASASPASPDGGPGESPDSSMVASPVVPPASGDETGDEARRSAPVAEKEDTAASAPGAEGADEGSDDKPGSSSASHSSV